MRNKGDSSAAVAEKEETRRRRPLLFTLWVGGTGRGRAADRICGESVNVRRSAFATAAIRKTEAKSGRRMIVQLERAVTHYRSPRQYSMKSFNGQSL